MRPDNLILLAHQHQFDKARRLTLSLCAIDLGPVETHDADVFVLLKSLLRCQPDTGRLWIGKGTPGDDAIVDFLLPNGHEGIAYGYPCLVSSHVCKEITTNHITNRQ